MALVELGFEFHPFLLDLAGLVEATGPGEGFLGRLERDDQRAARGLLGRGVRPDEGLERGGLGDYAVGQEVALLGVELVNGVETAGALGLVDACVDRGQEAIASGVEGFVVSGTGLVEHVHWIGGFLGGEGGSGQEGVVQQDQGAVDRTVVVVCHAVRVPWG